MPGTISATSEWVSRACDSAQMRRWFGRSKAPGASMRNARVPMNEILACASVSDPMETGAAC